MFFKMNTEERHKSESQSHGSRPCRPVLPSMQPISLGNQIASYSIPLRWSQALSAAGLSEGGKSTVIDNRAMASAYRIAGTVGNDISVPSNQTSNVMVGSTIVTPLLQSQAQSVPGFTEDGTSTVIEDGGITSVYRVAGTAGNDEGISGDQSLNLMVSNQFIPLQRSQAQSVIGSTEIINRGPTSAWGVAGTTANDSISSHQTSNVAVSSSFIPIQWSHAQFAPGFTESGKSRLTDKGMISASVVAGVGGHDISISTDQTTNLTVSGQFTGLMALANANYLPQAAGTLSETNVWPEFSRRESKTHGQLFGFDIKSAASVQGMAGTSTQQVSHDYGFPDSWYYDLNMPPQTTKDEKLHIENFQYAPFTPDKSIRTEPQKIDDFLANLSGNDKKTDEVTDRELKTTELELQVEKDLPSTANSAPSKETAVGIELNNTPEKKPKRKKIRPKVINEGKPRTQKRATPTITTSKDSTKPKRKYVRRNELDKATPAKTSAGSTNPIMMEPSNRTCKKALNFEMEGKQMEHHAELDAVSTMETTRGTEDVVPDAPSSISKNIPNQETKESMPLPEVLTTPTKVTCPPNILFANFLNIHKKRRTGKVQCPATPSHTSANGIINIVELGATSIEIAATPKFTSDSPDRDFVERQVGSEINTKREDRVYPQRVQSTEEMFACSKSNRRKRSKSKSQDNSFSSKAAEYCPEQTHANNAAPTDCTRHTPYESLNNDICVKALAAETSTLTRRRRTKKTSIINSSYLKAPESHPQILGGSQKDVSIEMLIKQLQNLDINREVQHGNKQLDTIAHNTQNALILYEREGTMVPYEGFFDPVKKRPPRPKVELDEETNRVWKLLLEDINSQGIDGTNEENMKRWEEEREVFHGRANSFIARMRLVQGDRHFSPWKGSVVDSVVGVFLTQNVSDHLSSSAFMTLAARFPRKTEEGTSTVTDETDLSILDYEDFLKSKERTSNRPACDKRNMTANSTGTDEENKAINSSESSRSITGERKAADDTASSQTSVDTSIPQTADKIGSCFKYSKPEDAAEGLNTRKSNSSTSFLELLQMQGPPFQMQGFNTPYEVYSHESTTILPKLPNTVPNQSQGVLYDYHRHQKDIFHLHKSIPGEKIGPYSISQLLLDTNPRLDHCPHRTIEGNRLSDALMNPNKDLDYMYNEHEAIAGASGPSVCSYISKTSAQRAEDPSGGLPDKDTAQQHENLSYSSCNLGDVTEITSTSGNLRSKEQKTAESIGTLHASTITSGNTKKSRSKQEDLKKNTAFDWDSLRREVESNGKKKRTDNTMDSLDWEAVRCAKVHEIAETIRERGMNHILAERIQAFLNRLVDDHGSIDLEWLRDIQPDKAKEYLLSIRGLGLKSVECVRLLTLHHLAFPVDVNVGRIAVRLGWVPLQPLPETLQIHLLELYPVLESIQKYLWPRLCKLDQKTLYELHYQLITFGKVFCTKSRPNCNACPMRGECRHFASAFASARLALPGPEDKSLVNITEHGASRNNPAETNHTPLPLPPGSDLSQGIMQLGEISGPSSIEPIIEMPGSPEPEPLQMPEGRLTLETDIEDFTWDNSEGIPYVNLDMEEFKHNLQAYVLAHQGGEISKALVALTPDAASIPMPQLKYVNRLRTEHQVYELPDSHPLLSTMDKREPDDPCSYLLAIWRPGETPNSTEPPEKTCNSQGPDNLCDDLKCFTCNGIREANSQSVRGTLLVPCRTAMRGSFPLNGTYFQVNEVFADHESSYNPIVVPRDWLWNLPRRTVYFGTSVSSIFKGLDCGKIQHCFWRGYVCVRGFEQKTRAPRPLAKRFHCIPSRQNKDKDKLDNEATKNQSNPLGEQLKV